MKPCAPVGATRRRIEPSAVEQGFASGTPSPGRAFIVVLLDRHPDRSPVTVRPTPTARPDLVAIAASLAVVHETAFARVHVGRPTRLIVLEWFAYANAAQYRQMLEDALVVAQALGCERWVAHNQQLKVIAPASQRFTTEDWWPRFATLPLKRLGIVVTEDDFGRLSLERIIARATPVSPFDIRHFPTFDGALSWVHDDTRDAAAAVRLTTQRADGADSRR